MKTTLKKPCKECPFRRESAPGWLGPWDAWELATTVQYLQFPCHRTIKADTEFDDPQTEKMETCAGTTLFLMNQMKMPDDPSSRILRDKFKSLPQGELNELKAGVFSSTDEFMNHHEWKRDEAIKNLIKQKGK